MSTHTLPRATLDDLMKVDGKAELINGRVVRLMPTGTLPTRLAKRTLIALDPHVVALAVGEAFGDSLGYAVDPPLPSGRQSFSPDVSYYLGPLPANLMRFIEGPPTFAVEIHSENDYGPSKEREHAEKRKDYFATGTLVVWDADPLAATVTAYSSADPLTPKVFGRGDTADAEPAVPGWRLSVDTSSVAHKKPLAAAHRRAHNRACLPSPIHTARAPLRCSAKPSARTCAERSSDSATAKRSSCGIRTSARHTASCGNLPLAPQED